MNGTDPIHIVPRKNARQSGSDAWRAPGSDLRHIE
jgi:hypothetical protein